MKFSVAVHLNRTDLRFQIKLLASFIPVESPVYGVPIEGVLNESARFVPRERGICPSVITVLLPDENLKRAFPEKKGDSGRRPMPNGRKYYWRSWRPL